MVIHKNYIFGGRENTVKIKVLYTTMIVKDLRESVAFYRDVLGFQEGYHVDLPGGAITSIER